MAGWNKIESVFSNEKKGLIILSFLWFFTQVVVYLLFGIKESVDSIMYINDSQLILDGGFPSGRNLWYSSYSIIIALLRFFGGDAIEVIYIQLVFSYTAFICLYKLTLSISKSNQSAFIAAFLYIVWIKIHQWNLILYTDSLFASLSIIGITLLHFSKNWKSYFLSLLVLIFTILIRPTGVGILIALIGYFSYSITYLKEFTRLSKIVIIGLLSIGAFFLVNVILLHHIDSFFNSYANAEIIYPNIPFLISQPSNLEYLDSHYPPLFRLIMFVVYNPIYFMKLSLVKGILFIANMKPYFSVLHNIVIGLFLYPIYYFMIKGLKVLPKNSTSVFLICFILSQFMIVSLTSENWDGRFLIPVLPFVFVISSLGITDFVNSKKSNLTNFLY